MTQEDFENYIDRVNKVAAILMQVWEDVEGEPVSASYVATFADMARAVVRDEMGMHD